MKREPKSEERYNSKDWTTQYKVKQYIKEKEIVTYIDTSNNQYTKTLKAFSNMIAKYEKST